MLEWFFRRRLVGLLTVCAVLLSVPARAEFFSDKAEDNQESLVNLSAAVKTEGVYDSNIFKTRFFPESDFYAVLQPQVALHAGYGPLSMDLGYQPRFLFFNKNSQNDGLKEIIQDLKFHSVVYSNDYFKLVLDDTLGPTRTFFAAPDTPDNISLMNQFHPQALVAFELGPRTVLDAGVEFERVDVFGGGQDFMSFGPLIGVTREINNVLSAVIKGSGHKHIYDSYSYADHYSLRGEGGFLININERFSGQTMIHYDQLLFSQQPDQGGWGYSVGLSYLATSTTRLGFDFRRDLSVDYHGQAIEATSFKGSVSQEIGQRTILFAEGYHTIFDVPSFSPVNDRVWGARAGLNYQITESLRAGIRYEFDTNIGPTVIDDFDSHRGIVSLDYDFGTLVNLF